MAQHTTIDIKEKLFSILYGQCHSLVGMYIYPFLYTYSRYILYNIPSYLQAIEENVIRKNNP